MTDRPDGACVTHRPQSRQIRLIIKDPGGSGNSPGAWSDWLESNVDEHSAVAECWLPIAGHEGSYEVSDGGRVRSLDRVICRRDGSTARHRGRVLVQTANRHGHLKVTIWGRTLYIHNLVLTTFVCPRPAGMECCHNDGDPTNNRLTNLRWDTQSENTLDRVRHGAHYEVNRTHCPLGHRLALPNLIAVNWSRGHRACWACHRARGTRPAQRAIKAGLPFDLKALADRYYEQILGGGRQ